MSADNTVAPPSLPHRSPEATGTVVSPAAVDKAVSTALVSIVVPCCGQLEHTRRCVQSLLRHSRRPCELIFVDLGSLDGTVEYLTGVADAASVPVEVVRGTETTFAAACQEGVGRAGGEFIVWLNNDTLVTEAWLQQLVALASIHSAIGLVGPMSNYAPSAQRVPSVPYRIKPRPATGHASNIGAEIDAIERFAKQWREEHKGKWFEVDRLGGFCLLFKRSVLNKLSLFDDKSEPGVLDADALSWKVRQAGYRCLCCEDLFIHHFGTRHTIY